MSALALTAIVDTDLPIPGADPWYALPEDPALTVMTDFRERASVTVTATSKIDDALEHMRHAGVRCALVTDEGQRVAGLITAYDIMSEKPMRYVQSVAGQRQGVLVRDIMVAVADWRVADVKDLERTTVGAVHRAFDVTQLTHIPVMERSENGQQRLRGLLSAARVRRLLAR